MWKQGSIVTTTSLLIMLVLARADDHIRIGFWSSIISSLDQSEIPFRSESVVFLVPEETTDTLNMKDLHLKARVKYTFDHEIDCLESQSVVFDLRDADNALNSNESEFSSCFWIFVDSKLSRDKLAMIKPNFESRVYTADFDGGNLSFFDHFVIDKSHDLQTTLVERWNISDNLLVKTFSSSYVWARRSDLQGINFKSGILNFSPYTIVSMDNASNASGFSIDILNLLGSEMNFSYTLTIPRDHSFGTLGKDGKYNGIVGMISNNEIDFSATLLRVTQDRVRVLDFSDVIISHHNLLVSKHDSVVNTKSILTMLSPFSWGVLALFTIVICVLALFIAFYLNSNHRKDIGVAVVGTFGLIAGQGNSSNQSVASIRVLHYTCLLFGLLLVNVFSANLASHISVKSYSELIKTLEDVEHNRMDLFVQGGTATYDLFANPIPGSVEERIYENQLKSSPYFTPYTLDNVIDSFIAHPRDSSAILNPSGFSLWLKDHKRDGCSLQTVFRPVEVKFAFPFRKNFPYLRAINYQLTKMRERGLLDHYVRKDIESHDVAHDYLCANNKQEHFEVVGIINVRGVFILLGLGMAICILVAIMEKSLKEVYQIRTVSKKKPRRIEIKIEGRH